MLGAVYVTADILLKGPLRDFDHWLYGRLLLVDDRNARWWTSRVLAEAGNEFILLPLLGVATLLASWRTWSIRPMVVSFISGASIGILIPGMKILTGRTKPLTHGHDTIFAGGTTYPSGHVVNSIVLTALILEFAVVGWPILQRWLTVRVRRWLVVVSTTCAGLGTLGLSYHWFTDVLTSWLIGAAMLLVLLGLDVFAPLHATLRAQDAEPDQVPRWRQQQEPAAPGTPPRQSARSDA